MSWRTSKYVPYVSNDRLSFVPGDLVSYHNLATMKTLVGIVVSTYHHQYDGWVHRVMFQTGIWQTHIQGKNLKPLLETV